MERCVFFSIILIMLEAWYLQLPYYNLSIY
uniref:Uncharacterized protein n=1 Tax=Siphoviridae sp. ctNZc11 TaxID=2827858 RepID=A0A8S5TC38_9CAUD|nr:MAG TPA: hypothetical protein [Siphoviridae sp. ctNZc11]DAL70130.1 MAG TPA: hypothetical protein [Caudoviricetes sp.]